MIPDYRRLMRPMLEASKDGELCMQDLVSEVAQRLNIPDEAVRKEGPRGFRTKFYEQASRAKALLKQARLIAQPRHGHVVITERGLRALEDRGAEIDLEYLRRYDDFRATRNRESANKRLRGRRAGDAGLSLKDTATLMALESIRAMPPQEFALFLPDLLIVMEHLDAKTDFMHILNTQHPGGASGTIDRHPPKSGRVYFCARRLGEDEEIDSSEMHLFLTGMMRYEAQEGIFLSTSRFNRDVIKTVEKVYDGLIVLIDGAEMGRVVAEGARTANLEKAPHLKGIAQYLPFPSDAEPPS